MPRLGLASTETVNASVSPRPRTSTPRSWSRSRLGRPRAQVTILPKIVINDYETKVRKLRHAVMTSLLGSQHLSAYSQKLLTQKSCVSRS